MCVAVAARIIETDGRTAKAEVQGNLLQVGVAVRNLNPGDYVLIHAGCAIEIIKKEQAEELAGLLQEMERLFDA